MADPPTGEDPGPVCAKWEVTPGSCGSKNFPTFPEKSFRDREAALADIGCALSAVELLEDPRLPAEPSGADVDKARVSLSAHLEPLRPPCTAPTCTVPASVLRPLVQLRGEVNWPLDPHPSLSIGAALETGIALGELASIPDQDRIRAAGSFVARERENAALGPLGATMEFGFARAPFLAYESPGASPYRASAALQIHHAKALGPSARVLFRLWLDRPLGDGQARDGGALVLEFLSR